MQLNKLFLAGQVMTTPALIPDQSRYAFVLRVRRQSGTDDLIPVRTTVMNPAIQAGEYVTVKGSVQTENYYSPEQRHLAIFAFAENIYRSTEEYVSNLKNTNSVEAYGVLCFESDHRETPAGKIVCDVVIECPRNKRIDFIHAIAWGRQALRASTLRKGQPIYISGRFQSRDYTKETPEGLISKTAYEVSIRQLKMITSPAAI